jgi:hypothetical protein
MSHRRHPLVRLLFALAAVGTGSWTAGVFADQKGEKTVYATAVDQNGQPIRDLTAQEWLIREDGADRQIVGVKPATESISDVRAGVLAFVHKLLGGSPTSQISIMSVSGTPTMLVDFGKPAADIEKAATRIFQDQSSGTVFLESIQEAGKRLAKVPLARRVILTINLDGFPELSQLQPQNVATSVLQSNASLWAVSYRNAATVTASTVAGSDIQHGASGVGSGNLGQARDLVLTNLSQQTGGIRLTVSVSSALETSLNQIADALLSQYAITYSRPDGGSPKVVQAAIARPGGHVLIARQAPK